jgi:hypothetical protein
MHSATCALLLAMTLACAAPVFGQAEEKDGRAWLEANREAAAVNVTGVWEGAEWGRIPLSQREGGRRIIGTGDGWDVSGVVSGNQVYLLFSHKGKVAFSAKLTADATGALTGVYAPGLLSPGSKTTPMHLSK